MLTVSCDAPVTYLNHLVERHKCILRLLGSIYVDDPRALMKLPAMAELHLTWPTASLLRLSPQDTVDPCISVAYLTVRTTDCCLEHQIRSMRALSKLYPKLVSLLWAVIPRVRSTERHDRMKLAVAEHWPKAITDVKYIDFP